MSYTIEYLVNRWTFDYENAPAVTIGIVPDVTVGGGGVTDHGALTGLTDNDHPQYARIDAEFILSAGSIPGPGNFVALANVTMPSALSMVGQAVEVTAGAPITVTCAGADLFTFEGGTTVTIAARDTVRFVAFDATPAGAPAGLWQPVSNVGAVRDALDASFSAVDDALLAADVVLEGIESAIVRDEPTAVFRCDGSNDGDWHTPHVGSFTGGYDFRAKVRPIEPDEPLDGVWYSEMGTQTRDSLVGTIDNHEAAIMRPYEPDWPGLTTNKPHLFLELTPTGETSEVTERFTADLHSAWAEWVTIRLTVNFATGTVTGYVEVWWEFSADETFVTTTDGRVWWQIGQLVNAAYDSIDTAITEVWQIGHNFYGDIAWVEWYSGIDGTRIAAPDASAVAAGATSFVDAEGNTWTAQSGAQLVQLDADYQPLDSDLTTIAGLSPSNDDVLQRKAGAWTNRTIPQLRTDLAQANVVLHSETVASDAASKQYDVTGWARVRVEYMGRSTRNGTTDTLLMTLNGNTGSVYSTDAAALTTSLALGTIPGISTNTDRLALVEAEIALLSGFLKGGWSRSTGYVSTATVGQAITHRGLFSTITAAVTTLELKMSLGSIYAGARIRIIGI